MYLDLVKCHRQ